jgi:cytochrome b subunit of formate dehydrogenase
MMQKSSIASIILGIILMAVGGVAIWRLLGLLTTAAIIPAVLLALALTALFIGFILVVMPALYYAYILFVRGVSILLKPGKAVWILALSLYLAGCALLIIHEMHIAG